LESLCADSCRLHICPPVAVERLRGRT
jgi:hypothetical protein